MSRKAWGIGAAVCAGLLLLFSLSSCGERRQELGYAAPVQATQMAPQVVAPQVVAAAPAPVVVQQAPSHDGLLTGMLLGHMLSQSAAPHYAPAAPAYAAPSRTVINRTTIINQAPPAPTPVAKAGPGIQGVVPAVMTKPAAAPVPAPAKQASVAPPAPRVTAVAGTYSPRSAYSTTTYRSTTSVGRR